MYHLDYYWQNRAVFGFALLLWCYRLYGDKSSNSIYKIEISNNPNLK